MYPYILSHYLSDLGTIINCSTTYSDMTDRGALKTNGSDILYRLSKFKNNILIIGGGECLFCGWKEILSYVSECEEDERHKTKFPFTIGKNELKNLDIVVYNSVGGYQLNERPEWYNNKENIRILESADFISVRDRITSLGISRMNLVHCIRADSAILISKLYDDNYLRCHMSERARRITSTGRYLFFQIGLQHLKEWEKDYASVLTNVSKEKGLHICMCPIGTALGHDDDKALSVIASYMPKETYTIVDLPSVWDIMGLIRWSEIYVGSSLHGAITAMSYRRPLIAYGPRKLQIYIETWYDTIGSEYSFVAMDNLEEAIMRRIDSKFTICPDEQIRSAEESMKLIRGVIASY